MQITKTNIELAEAALGGKVRIIDMNSALGEITFALASETQGYPIYWKITKTFVTK